MKSPYYTLTQHYYIIITSFKIDLKLQLQYILSYLTYIINTLQPITISLTLQRFFKHHLFIYRNLKPFHFNKKISISFQDINSFDSSFINRGTNDRYNKIRETIICSIINHSVPPNYYTFSYKWHAIRDGIMKYINNLSTHHQIVVNQIKCSLAAGRRFHYDFIITFNNTIHFPIEFKFNASSIQQIPQFVSPMKPSQYMYNDSNITYEEYYFDNFLIPLFQKYDIYIPDKTTYLNTIHTNNPFCILQAQEKYYAGCSTSSHFTNNLSDISFYQEAKLVSKNSIQSFIEMSHLDISKLSEYLTNTQRNKIYMLYQNFTFHKQLINADDYIISSYKKEQHLQRYIATTNSGLTLYILLRWKNGNGIAYPAFQIS